jgi:hypothetical protein
MKFRAVKYFTLWQLHTGDKAFNGSSERSTSYAFLVLQCYVKYKQWNEDWILSKYHQPNGDVNETQIYP